ncbi:amidase signature domain-containing protein [Ilyonectria sp. MPI-CAGE-AT-0026]|nr:amidase signature domain-containing protein [Ilyonectria sp. MPI-CAGE-AT-0026]
MPHTRLTARRGATPFILYNIRDGVAVSEAQLQDFRSGILEPDVSFQANILQLIVFYGTEEAVVYLQPSAIQLLKEVWKAEWEFAKFPNMSNLDSGPYLGYEGHIFQPWRIYHDQNLTMTVTYQPNRGSLRMVVPPQSYANASAAPDKPLKGVTIAVKDIFDIEGSKTTLCNRAWAEYQSPKTHTAPSIKRLQDLGAWVVGKTRLNAMVVREETMECVEWLAPYNPRGDGYQTSSGSSSGSCAALGAYPWIDFAIGSDTNGSCRKPAYWNGCFAIRPTHGVLDTQGVASFCPYFDVPSFFGRDISRFRHFAELWYGDSNRLMKDYEFGTSGTRILYPLDYLPTSNAPQMRLIDSFVEDLEHVLGTKRTPISLAELWKKSPPDSVVDKDLSEYLKTARLLLIYPHQAGTLPYYKDAIGIVKEFYDGYTAKFGKTPFVHRALLWRWETADQVTPEDRDEGWARIYTYRKWLLDNIFTEGSILVLPIDEGRPNYRDTPPPPFGLLSGYSSLYISPIAGIPEVTAPSEWILPQLVRCDADEAEISEPFPISVSVAGPPGEFLGTRDLVVQTLSNLLPIRLNTGRSIL